MSNWSLRVNGQLQSFDAAKDMPLLWVLRDRLKLMGTKYGCGIGKCGTCAVHLDGRVVASCMVPVSEIGDREVMTIEGLSPDRSHPLQRAWIELQVPQCGYCHSGQLMAAAGLLAKNSRPSDNEIDAMMAHILCRCGTYPRIRAAIHRAAEIMLHEAESS